MLKPQALGNAFAATTAILYFFLFILNELSPPFFRLFFNSRFLGADVSSQISQLHPVNFLGALIAVSLFSWVFGYFVATIYNKQTKPNTPTPEK